MILGLEYYEMIRARTDTPKWRKNLDSLLNPSVGQRGSLSIGAMQMLTR